MADFGSFNFIVVNGVCFCVLKLKTSRCALPLGPSWLVDDQLLPVGSRTPFTGSARLVFNVLTPQKNWGSARSSHVFGVPQPLVGGAGV